MQQKTSFTNTMRWRIAWLAAVWALFYGCAAWPVSEPVSVGDAVAVDYVCRIAEGAILATTREAVIKDEAEQLSHAFVPFRAYQPEQFTIGAYRSPWQGPDLHPLREEIAFRLAGRLQGLRYGRRHHLALASAPIEGLPEQERTITFAVTYPLEKERTLPVQQFEQIVGKPPAVGEILFEDKPVQWEVIEALPDSVTVRFRVKQSHAVKMPEGPAVIRDQGEHFEVTVDARVGQLVRVGPYVGQVSAVEQGRFTADFSHPFGGRELACEVVVQRAPASERDVEQAVRQAPDGL